MRNLIQKKRISSTANYLNTPKVRLLGGGRSSDIDHYHNKEFKHNMFVVGKGTGEVAVTNRKIREKFKLEQLPVGYISLDNKRPVYYQK
ncbi:MAG: hypothetical protein LBC85_04920 [Fibromonadaceae bacterium]|jgi:hypothetical protein|nr:hypothetical protein [Fibromonadaceae bacterium]